MLAVTSTQSPRSHFTSPTTRYLEYTNSQRDNVATKKAMYHELCRLRSYEGWPNNHIKPEDLAKAGFFYTRVGDRVRCPFCHLEIESWEEGDNAKQDHERWSSGCSFINGRSCGNVPLDYSPMSNSEANEESYDTCGRYGIEIRPNSFPERDLVNKYAVPRVKGPTYPDYNTLEKRLESFKEWPISIRQRPRLLGEAGFFYTGKGDKTVCFHCGGGLKNWEEGDDPWEQHAKWFSACEYLTLQKGPKFISDVCKKDVPVLSAKDAASITSTNNNLNETNGEAVTEPSQLGQSDNLHSVERDVAGGSSDHKKLSMTSFNNVESVPTLDKSSDESSSSTLCKICYNKEIGVAFLPCGHVVACVDCAPALTKCAVCCGEIAASCRVFLS